MQRREPSIRHENPFRPARVSFATSRRWPGSPRKGPSPRATRNIECVWRSCVCANGFNACRENVTAVAHGFDQLEIIIVAKLLAQPAHQHVDRAIEYVVGAAVRQFDQLI